jgi:hypothetical protein
MRSFLRASVLVLAFGRLPIRLAVMLGVGQKSRFAVNIRCLRALLLVALLRKNLRLKILRLFMLLHIKLGRPKPSASHKRLVSLSKSATLLFVLLNIKLGWQTSSAAQDPPGRFRLLSIQRITFLQLTSSQAHSGVKPLLVALRLVVRRHPSV